MNKGPGFTFYRNTQIWFYQLKRESLFKRGKLALTAQVEKPNFCYNVVRNISAHFCSIQRFDMTDSKTV